MSFRLCITEYRDEDRWRWVLADEGGTFVADHEVDLSNNESPEARAFRDLPGYLWRYRGVQEPEEILGALGAWMGEEVFGTVGKALAERRTAPATVVRVAVPEAAQALLARPFELACLPAEGGDGGRTLADAGVRFVYHLEGAPRPAGSKARGETFRVLAVFSLPHGENPLSLRRERVELEARLRRLAQTGSRAIELRVLQYGATRETLRDALEEAAGWDLVHVSGHGLEGELVLEDGAGNPDRIGDGELADLLAPARARLHLLTLSTCLSGAGSVRAARRQVGLDPPRRETAAAEERTEGPAGTEATGPPEGEEAEVEAAAENLPLAVPLPSLGQSLARRLDCAVLAMRFSVGDDFARELVLALYEKLLGKGQPLPAALQLALGDALSETAEAAEAFPLSPITPILFGPRAADLILEAPPASPSFELPETGLSKFPRAPERFVGRVRPMLRATAALAPEGRYRGVLFHGMAGGGKTACALELAYRHERGRFEGMAWWKAPDPWDDEAEDVAGALTDLAVKLEHQLPGLVLVGLLDDPTAFRERVLPRLRQLLREHAVLIVLDNLESLLTSGGRWRDERWGDLVTALLDHDGTSRVVLTSRRVPADLEGDGRLLREPIHALSFPESVLLARELPALNELFATPEGRGRLRRVLAAAQGHPKLLELADGAAQENLDALDRLVGGPEGEGGGEGAGTAAGFFTEGESGRDVEEFVRELERWTRAVSDGLPPTARFLFGFLCCLEEGDRQSGILEAVWEHFLRRLGEGVPGAGEALAGGKNGLQAALDRLAGTGLVEVEEARPPGAGGEPAAGGYGETTGAPPRVIRLHPAVAGAGRDAAGLEVRSAVDRELGDFWVALSRRAYEQEMEGAGGVVVLAGLQGALYLLRTQRWGEAGILLQRTLHRDKTPATVARILTHLERIAAATEGGDDELSSTGVLAKALAIAGRHGEAEGKLRELVDRAEARGAYPQASAAAGSLINLLLTTGRAAEALAVVERKTELTRRAGLGPWTRLGDEGRRLQVLNALGRYREVLDEVGRLRSHMAALPEESEAEEAVDRWAVRGGVLDCGRKAALRLREWRSALDFNEEIGSLMVARGAGELELAARRFNDHGPLLALGKVREARHVLEACRRIFESKAQLSWLGKTMGALAEIESREGNSEGATRFQVMALRYSYQAGDPEDCAIGHNNLAGHLAEAGGEIDVSLAHWLAAAAIDFQAESGLLLSRIHNLARAPLPPDPPPFEGVVAVVERLDGVRFRDLYETLPRRAPDGDAVLAEVWKLVEQERAAPEERRRRAEEALASAPAPVREAIEANDPEALNAALRSLPPEEAEEVLERLREAGVLGEAVESAPDMDRALRELDPFLRSVAAVARGEEEPRERVEEALPKFEEKGWHLTEPVRRIWEGERDPEALTEGLDAQDSRVVRRILELIDAPTPEEALAAVPAPVREAVEAQDHEALQAALASLPEEETSRVVKRLVDGGILSPE